MLLLSGQIYTHKNTAYESSTVSNLRDYNARHTSTSLVNKIRGNTKLLNAYPAYKNLPTE